MIFYVYITIVLVAINIKQKRKSADALSIPGITKDCRESVGSVGRM
jgi:hypothetical protein